MERTLEFKGKKYKVNNLIIEVDGNLTLAPGEVPIATALISMAGAMSNMKTLPAEISNSPFTIKFMENGSHSFTRGTRGEMLSFTFEEVDDIIEALQMAMDVSVDLQKLAPQTIPVHFGSGFPDTFDGRD